jgi:phosphonate transport system substrate-binding protein
MSKSKSEHKYLVSFLSGAVAFLCSIIYLNAAALSAEKRDVVPLRMGFIYQASIRDTVTRYQPFFDYLEKRLPIKIEPAWYDNGYQLIMDLKNGLVDLVMADGTLYLFARDRLKANQIAVKKVKGKYTRRAVIIVRNDSGLERFEQLRGRRVALVGPFDEMSTLWIRSRLKAMGETMDGFFHSVVNTMSCESSILNTVLKEVDASVIEKGAYIRERNINAKVRETLKVIDTSPPYSNQILISGRTMNKQIVNKIRSVLITMNNSLEGNAVLASIHSDGFDIQENSRLINDQKLMRFFPKVE